MMKHTKHLNRNLVEGTIIVTINFDTDVVTIFKQRFGLSIFCHILRSVIMDVTTLRY